MLRSMTGYGQALLEQNGYKVSVETRSLNHRFTDVSLKLPRGLGALEPDLRDLVQQRIKRGRISLTVELLGSPEGEIHLVVDRALADQYMELVVDLSGRYGLEEQVSLSDLLSVPDIITKEQSELQIEGLRKVVLAAAAEALEQLDAMRKAEADLLVADLRKRLKEIDELARRVEQRIPERITEAQAQLHERIQRLMNDQLIDEQRLALEVAVFADRIDCTEECVRLHSHVAQASSFLNEEGPVGRRLTFLLQEMVRETNTIGSKAADTEISPTVVAMKESLEKIREQVENLE